MQAFLQPNPAAHSTTRLSILQLHAHIKKYATRAGDLDIPDGWPLEHPSWTAESYPEAPQYRGMAALYLAANPQRSSSDFKKWWSKRIVHKPPLPGKKAKKYSDKQKDTQIAIRRAVLIDAVARRWETEEESLWAQHLVSGGGGGALSVVQSALASADNASKTDFGEAHRIKLCRTCYALTTGLKSWSFVDGFLKLDALMDKAWNKFKPAGMCCSIALHEY
jgi:hypothetical protein